MLEYLYDGKDQDRRCGNAETDLPWHYCNYASFLELFVTEYTSRT